MKRKRTAMIMAVATTLPLDDVDGWVLPTRASRPLRHRSTLVGPTLFTRTFLRCSRGSSSYTDPPSWESALAIIPPDDAWNCIQEARYLANDEAYTSWPPAIRLLHPFTTALQDTALDVAQLVEKYQIEPFQLHMTEWSIIPHQEAMTDIWKAMDTTSVRKLADEGGEPNNADRQDEEDAKFTALVDRLERLGRLRKSRRKLRERQKQMELDAVSEYHNNRDDAGNGNGISTESSIPSTFIPEDEEGDISAEEEELDETAPSSAPPKRRYRRRADALSDKERRDQQQLSMMEEFNGPCVVCLEPDAASKAKLVHLRQLLCDALPGAQQLAAYYTPSASSPLSIVPTSSSSVSSSYAAAERQDTDGFRPVIPIASFTTVTEAIEVARTLRRDWEPLSFNVTDFHLISSCETSDSVEMEEEEGDVESSARPAAPLISTHWDTSLLPRPPTTYRYPFGCDALVSLIGEEVAMDDDLNFEMAQMVAQKGTSGGFNEKLEQQNRRKLQGEKPIDAAEDTGTQRRKQRAGKFPPVKPNKPAEEMDTTSDPPRSQLEEWLLEEDEAYDEGMVVVMGRVQMFTGEMREYVGMPASKSLGDMVKKSKMSARTTVVPTSSQFSQHTVLDAHAEQQRKMKQSPSNLWGTHE